MWLPSKISTRRRRRRRASRWPWCTDGSHVFTAHNGTRTTARHLSILKYVAWRREKSCRAPCFLSDRHLNGSVERRPVQLLFSFSPCSRKLPFGVWGQLQLGDVGEHRPVAGWQAGDPDQWRVGVHGGVGIQGHLLGCKNTTVIVSENVEMMWV